MRTDRISEEEEEPANGKRSMLPNKTDDMLEVGRSSWSRAQAQPHYSPTSNQ